MKKVLITSGGIREKIDEVRVLTNISTGKLGASIAEHFLDDLEWEVIYVHGKGSVLPLETMFHKGQVLKTYEVSDTNSLLNTMKELVPNVDLVIHCMAVSDFTFKPLNSKLKSSSPEDFIESLRERIVKTPKILSMIKDWNPDCKIVSFKFEVAIPHEELIKIAMKSGIDNSCDVVIANDKDEMKKAGSHVAYAVDPKVGELVKLNSKAEISAYLHRLYSLLMIKK